MTSISGYRIVSAPCCGKSYNDPAYASINTRDWHRWSDGHAFGSLYQPTPPVCLCACGAYFLADEATAGQAGLDDSHHATMPWLRDRQAHIAIEKHHHFTDGRVECEVRLQYWHLLNHRYRITDNEEVPNPRMTSEGIWSALTDDETDERIRSNLERLTPLLEKYRPDNLFLIGEAYRARGLMAEAIAHFRRASKVETPVIEHLIELANVGAQRVVRIEPPDWHEKPKKPEPWVNPHPHGEIIDLASRDYWYSGFSLRQQGWALVDPCRDDIGCSR